MAYAKFAQRSNRALAATLMAGKDRTLKRGKDMGILEKTVKNKLSQEKIKELTSRKLLKTITAATDVIELWKEWAAMETDEPITWAAKLKASELYAKHKGLLGLDGVRLQVNVGSFDAKQAGEADLLSQLQEIEEKKRMESAIDVDKSIE